MRVWLLQRITRAANRTSDVSVLHRAWAKRLLESESPQHWPLVGVGQTSGVRGVGNPGRNGRKAATRKIDTLYRKLRNTVAYVVLAYQRATDEKTLAFLKNALACAAEWWRSSAWIVRGNIDRGSSCPEDLKRRFYS